MRETDIAKKDRLIAQYRASPNFIAEISAVIGQVYNPLDSLGQAIRRMEHFFDIDQAGGEWLRIIGVIVGQKRTVFSFFGDYFGFDGNPISDPFNTGVFWDGQTPTSGDYVLSDADYRRFIKAKIVRNHSSGTIPDFIAGMAFIFPTAVVSVIDNMDMTASISITGVTAAEANLIEGSDILPRPAGVYLDVTTSYF